MEKIYLFGLLEEGIFQFLFISIVIAAVVLIAYFINLHQYPERLGRRELNDAIQMLLNRLNTKTAAIETGTELALSKAEEALSSVDQLRERTKEQKGDAVALRIGLETALGAQTTMVRSLSRINQKILDLVGGQERMQSHVRKLGEGYRELLPEAEKPVIPATPLVSREVTTAQLTHTEMVILQTLASSGAKTASEIREVIGKTREHSARLMKKLYVEGYIERDTSSLPYGYKLSEKIRKSFEFSKGEYLVKKDSP